jgi:hypothetical protein
VRILYINDKDAGSSIKVEGTTVPSPVKYLAVWRGIDGVEGHSVPDLAMPGNFELGPSYPNPAKGMAEFTYALPVPREVDLSVYNIQGQLVKRLVSGYKTPGYHMAQWEMTGVPAGVYLCRLSAGEFKKTRTMVVVR